MDIHIKEPLEIKANNITIIKENQSCVFGVFSVETEINDTNRITEIYIKITTNSFPYLFFRNNDYKPITLIYENRSLELLNYSIDYGSCELFNSDKITFRVRNQIAY